MCGCCGLDVGDRDRDLALETGEDGCDNTLDRGIEAIAIRSERLLDDERLLGWLVPGESVADRGRRPYDRSVEELCADWSRSDDQTVEARQQDGERLLNGRAKERAQEVRIVRACLEFATRSERPGMRRT